ncbi:MAG: DUF3592 domain-containing protein [Thiogranum sp.]
MQPHIKRIFIFLTVAMLLSVGGSYLYENNYVSNSVVTTGKIVSFKRKAISSAQGDPIEMEIEFTAPDNRKHVFYSSRNVIEHVTGKYRVGDEIPVLYNAAGYPLAKIGYVSHAYQITFVFLVVGALFFCGLVYAWRASEKARGREKTADAKRRR